MRSPEQLTALVFADLAIIIIATRAGALLARRLRQPAVIGELLAAVALGPSLFGSLSWGGQTLDDRLFPLEVRPGLNVLANLGLVIFMFVVGMELDLHRVRKAPGQAVAVSLTSVCLPMLLGIALATVLNDGRLHGSKFVAFCLFIGVAMSVTAFPVLARILAERRMLRTPLGTLSLTAAAIDDVLAWSLLAIAVALATAHDSSSVLRLVIGTAVLAAVLVWLARPLLNRLAHTRATTGQFTATTFALLLAGVLFSSYLTSWLGIHFILGAFLFGVAIPRDGGAPLIRDLLPRLEDFGVIVLLPVYFVMTGLNVHALDLDRHGLAQLVVVVAIACVGKFGGAWLGARSQRMPGRTAAALAVLLNTRGLTEIVVVSVGHDVGLVNDRLFTVLVLMALITTCMTEPLLRWIYPERLVARDVAAAERAALESTPLRRVLVVLSPANDDAELTRLGESLLGREPRSELVLSVLHRARSAPGGLGSGLTVELGELADSIEMASAAAATVRSEGVETDVLSRLSDDPARDLREQLGQLQPDLVLLSTGQQDVGLADGCTALVTVHGDLAGLPQVDHVVVEVMPGPDVETVLEVGLRLSAELGWALTVSDGTGSRRWNRRITAALGRLAETGLVTSASVDSGAGGDQSPMPDATGLLVRGRVAAQRGATAPIGLTLVVTTNAAQDPQRWEDVVDQVTHARLSAANRELVGTSEPGT